ncbi:tRNA-dihydrouridine synthase [Bacillus sonorensis]|uniref:NADH:flavin oxidoreductase n=2 Tax=Bacillus sonorensis TaxID=119858 RepID=M5P5L5_9BACI|nr:MULTISPECIES: tRNA-dihydrouridine synthase [Bacillus]ASB90048.1 NADPH dehydrogenase [Bacillus sonorensis]EME74719.1 NADH:flavin oxidoreductase [Bacillus sonorensis L12]MBG9916744.1 NADH:flavin oxidoreductase [Bacillus sonorensis]MCF7619297.1 tRNA-dihydrouridine synthase [Bacillus sonorensis]MCY7855660.1 tRNA-dihydrouridine synthase [Bacillus sonorensis]
MITTTSLNLDTPLTIGGIELRNRFIMAPMQQYKGSPEGYATEHHVQHYSRRAKGIGLMIVESTAVSDNGRLWPNDIGIYSDRHTEMLKRVTDAVHTRDTPIFVQLSHGGRKSAPEVTDRLIAPSAIPYDESYGKPAELSISEIEALIEDYRMAARRSIMAGFDGIEVHAAHGFLIHQFLSPISNLRNDAYGGTRLGRMKFLKDTLAAIRSETGRNYPVIVRISSTDYIDGGLNPQEHAMILKSLEADGLLDGVDVSSGGLLPIQPADIHPGYQLPDAAAIKQHLQIPVIAVGKIYTRSFADRIIRDGLADAVAIGRPLLEDPDFAQKMIGLKE